MNFDGDQQGHGERPAHQAGGTEKEAGPLGRRPKAGYRTQDQLQTQPGVASCSRDWRSESVLEVTVRPGDNVTVYCDCTIWALTPTGPVGVLLDPG
ncbi:hypothetical protein EYF80_032012 [Liparis tanakae]|uniref:Uncharacterized protein n=1 Tax=Liparis tanakae TaxID=230148 RepID=A0A4Z2GYP7_9TELE|nr:hypothetical protein EYF80_032012 [Liparis tanakae]